MIRWCIWVTISECIFLKTESLVLLDDFYPFGSNNNDAKAPTNDDGSTEEIPISSLFPFFNHQHDSLIVNTNGVISFLGTMSTFTPSAFPLDNNRRLVAPYWADVDTRNGGDIWYRESTDVHLLQKVSLDIRNIFAEHYNFQASWIFIATWRDVAFYGADVTGQTKRCTFQCILITNGRHSFTIFLYNKVQWTTGTASGGDSSTGLGGTPAQVGFDAGDGNNYFAVDASRTNDIINIVEMSNVNVPGKFVFSVDSSAIEEGGCNVEGTLVVYPRQASMFGGNLLYLSGPCFKESDITTLWFDNSNETSCKWHSDYIVKCVCPPLYRTGKEQVEMKVIHSDDSNSTFSGRLTIVNHAVTSHILKRRQSASWKNGAVVTVDWLPADLLMNDSHIHIDLFYPFAEGNTYTFVLKNDSRLTTFNGTLKDVGSFSFVMNYKRESGILRISGEDNGPYYWTDMFTVFVNKTYSQFICTRWMETEQLLLRSISGGDSSPCPCSIEVAEIDTARFQIDPLCESNDISSGISCLHQPRATQCFRQVFSSSLGYDSQCCYDSTGSLMDSSNGMGSGFTNRYHLLDNSDYTTPFLSSFIFDIIPYENCCVYAIENYFSNSAGTSTESSVHNFCNSMFYEQRPPNSCVNYRAPRAARITGDPHFVTLDGFRYTFNSIGEFIAIQKENFTLQMRLERFNNSQGTSLTSIAAQTSDTSDIVEVKVNTQHGMDLIINGESDEFEFSNSVNLDGTTIQKTPNQNSSITLTFQNPSVSIIVMASLDILNLFFIVSEEEKTGSFAGLLGNYDGDQDNDMISRNGTKVGLNASSLHIHTVFGNSWRINENESLFTYLNGQTYDFYQDTTFNATASVPDNLTSVITDLCGTINDCIYDYYLTGSSDVGNMSSQMYNHFEYILTLLHEDAIETTGEEVKEEEETYAFVTVLCLTVLVFIFAITLSVVLFLKRNIAVKNTFIVV